MCTSESRAERTLSKPKENPHPLKIKMTVKTPIGVILVVILIRTETTLDHSQKAEKVYQPPLYPDSFTKRGSTTKRNPTGGFSRDILATVA